MEALWEGAVPGPRIEIAADDEAYPAALMEVHPRPERLCIIGDPRALEGGIAIVGARKATPYGFACAARFAAQAAEAGATVINGGARGCDAAALRAAVDAGGRAVAFLGGGLARPYPADNAGLFRDIVESGGALVSEQPWDTPPLPYMFRERNRLIAGLAQAVLIVEAGLPSGTFSTADEALDLGKEVLAVPGPITSPASAGSNMLIAQGAVPMVDGTAFAQALAALPDRRERFAPLRAPAPDLAESLARAGDHAHAKDGAARKRGR